MAGHCLQTASLFCVDEVAQFDHYRQDGYFAGYPTKPPELAHVLAGSAPAPSTGRRFFVNLGLAMEDVAFGGLFYRRAVERGIGRRIRLD